MIYICIPVYNRVNLTIKCINSIYKQTYKEYNIIVFDDGSIDNTSEILKTKFPNVTILKGDGTNWWSGSVNKCIKYILKTANNNDYIYTLNNDTELLKNTLRELLKVAVISPNSIVGTLNVFYSDNKKIEPSAYSIKKILGFTFYHSVHFFSQNINTIENDKNYISVNSLSGKGVLIPIKVFKTIGLYRSTLLPQYHSDTEFTIRANKSGFNILLSLKAILLSHVEMTGKGTIKTNTGYWEFLKSFFDIRSPYYLKSLFYYNKLIHPKFYIIYFMINFLIILFNNTKNILFKN